MIFYKTAAELTADLTITKMDNRKAIDILNDVIRMLNKNKCYESTDKLDEVRQFLGGTE